MTSQAVLKVDAKPPWDDPHAVTVVDPLEEILEQVKREYAQQKAQVELAARSVEIALRRYVQISLNDLARAVRARNGLPPTGPVTDTAIAAATHLAEVVWQLPELRPPPRLEDESETGAETDWDVGLENNPAAGAEHILPPRFPLLAACGDRPILIVGGIPVPQKERWVRRMLGLPTAAWVECPHNAPGGLLSRIRRGKVHAVVILEKLLDSTDRFSLAGECSASGVPCATAWAGGQGDLTRAFEAMEAWLMTRPAR